MKLHWITVLGVLSAAGVKASIIPASGVSNTYALPDVPVATSYQAVTHNVNQLPSFAYPGYTGSWPGYPYNYHRLAFDYGYPFGHVHSYGYGYRYPFGHGATAW